MKFQDTLKRVDEIIGVGNAALNHGDRFREFRSAALSFIERTFSRKISHYEDFQFRITDDYVEDGIAILNACRSEIKEGWLFFTKGLVSTEVFSDFVEMAEHLLK